MAETVSPNAALRSFIQRFFADGANLASLRYHIVSHSIKMPLLAVVRGGLLVPQEPLPNEGDLRGIVTSQLKDHILVQDIAKKYAWENGKLAAEFVALLCANLHDLDARVSAAAFNSRTLGGLPTTAKVRMEPSSTLSAALHKAIALQQGGSAARAVMGCPVPASNTCLVVSLTDCIMLRAEEQRNPCALRSASYAHSFALLVDTTGVGLYQAWGTGAGQGGYMLHDWLQRSPVNMSHHAATEFAHTFEQFCEFLTWDDVANGMYLQLFGIDVRAVAEENGLAPPTRIRSWVRVLEVSDVTADRIYDNSKFFM